MRTDEWIEMLARNAGPAPRAAVARRLVPAWLIGILASIALALGLFGPQPAEVFMKPNFWIKFGYVMALAGVASLLTSRLARPLSDVTLAGRLTGLVITGMAILGLLSLGITPEGERMRAIFGQTWLLCPLLVFSLSLPALIAILLAMRELAPTRLAEAGWSAGLLAGALGATGYALSCPESSPTFVALWYTLGLLLTAGLGRVLVPFVLRW